MEEGGAAASDALLREAKYSIPQARRGTVSRAHLIDAARASGHRVVGVTAPAGYGKSTLLAEWARREERDVAWLSLDRFDDDPAILLALLATAYARIEPGHDAVLRNISGVGASVLGRAAPRLASVLKSSSSPFVLILDDLHELTSPECHDVLSVVIGGVPDGSQLIAASRAEQPHLPRLRASDDTIELGAQDLALDASGAEQIFSHTSVTLTTDAAADIARRTEGWPVGLHLAALIARDSGADGLAVSGDDRYVADYLYREALSRLTPDDQQFLRRSAVVDQLCASLCDAVVDDVDAQQRLRRLDAANLFLFPLDRRRQWYRYHGLFREFLMSELRRTEPSIIMTLHRRAADWYEANGSPAMAVEHLLLTDDRDRCTHLVSRLFLPTLLAGQLSTIQRWLSTLGDSAIETCPPLAVLATWAAAYRGHIPDAQRWAAFVDDASYEPAPPDGSSSFDSSRAMLRSAMCPDGPERMMADASIAFAQEPPWSSWRDTALNMFAEAHLLNGDAERAAALFAEGSEVSAVLASTDPRIFGESEQAFMAISHGRWDEAGEHVDVALAIIEQHEMRDYPTSALAFAAASRVAIHEGKRALADRHLVAAMRLRPLWTYLMPFAAVRLRLHLAKAYATIDDHAAAHHLLSEIDDILTHRPALGSLVDEVEALRQSHAARTSGGGVTGATPLTPAELRLLPFLQTHLTAGDIAKRLFVSINTVNSQLGSIYRKLGVASRREAVDAATAVGLLGG